MTLNPKIAGFVLVLPRLGKKIILELVLVLD
jgi:hypothetical protein